MRTGNGHGGPGLQPKACGFTYFGILCTVVLIGLGLAGTGNLWSITTQRNKERQLLRAGHDVRRAIRDYYVSTPSAVKQYPATLEILMLDPRFPQIKRHLRRIPVDPMTGNAQWGIVEAPEGGIMGIYSLSNAPPLKRANFRMRDAEFAGKSVYDEWKFVYTPDGK